ncbi:hypothetical protein GOP47_0009376 [Adiantum capillus-veneris]|uniref:ATP-dependent RNA helicase n=1 Tax=Adiantum capillus-veneris TaxID=13818 RepID=A0A9D4UW34_ADICA|nr:hypothetical protein GOP47_0009376 [Adiantum capillus-veneris]
MDASSTSSILLPSLHRITLHLAACMADEERLLKEETYKSFKSMNLHEDLLRGISACGFDKPSPIQQRATVPFCKGRHMVVQAQPGSGVRDMISVGILQQLNYSLSSCQALVLVLNRDLVLSIKEKIRRLGEFLHVKVHTCTGGTSVREDRRILASGVHVVIGTIGRVLDLLERSRGFVTNHIKILVFYGAEDMINGKRSTQENYDIFKLLPSNIQVCMFSTFETPAILTKTAHELMDKPFFVTEKLHLSEGLKHYTVKVMREGQKLDKVFGLFQDLPITQCVIFVNNLHKVHALQSKMLARDPIGSVGHGCTKKDIVTIGMSQFKCGSSSILVTTHMCASRLETQESCLIVNYDVPHEPEKYLQRVSGRKGVTISFVTREDEWSMSNIERLCNVVFEELSSYGDLKAALERGLGTRCTAHDLSGSVKSIAPSTEEPSFCKMVELEAAMHNSPTQEACMGDEEHVSKEKIYGSFESMNLHKDLLRGIHAFGIDKTSSVQQRATVPFCEGRHMILQAQPGSGVRGMLSIGKNLQIRGVPTRTTGRVFDMLRRKGGFVINHIKIVVLYDAGDMIEGKGSTQVIYDIFKLLPSNIQICMFSTFVTPAILTELAHELKYKPFFLAEKLCLPEGLKHYIVKVTKKHKKLNKLCDLFRDLLIQQCVVFVNSRHRVHELQSNMLAGEHVVSAVHGSMKEDAASNGMSQFKCGSSSILITTDMCASSLETQEGCLIVNYDVPFRPEWYLRRIFGRKGVTISFVARKDERGMSNIQRLCNVEFKELSSNVDLKYALDC